MSVCSPSCAGCWPAGPAGALPGAAGAGAAGVGAACVVGGFAPPFFFRGCASTPPAMKESAEASRQTRATHVRIIFFLAFHEPRGCCGGTILMKESRAFDLGTTTPRSSRNHQLYSLSGQILSVGVHGWARR